LIGESSKFTSSQVEGSNHNTDICQLSYAFFSAFFATFAGLDLPNDPLKIFPFFVFLSPLPMIDFYLVVQMSVK
jgi:hypothetical protein